MNDFEVVYPTSSKLHENTDYQPSNFI